MVTAQSRADFYAQPSNRRLPVTAIAAALGVQMLAWNMLRMTLFWLALELTQNAALVSLFIAVMEIPNLLATFFAGGLVRRFGAKRLAIVSRCLLTLLCGGFLLFSGFAEVRFPIVIAVAILGTMIVSPVVIADRMQLPAMGRYAGIPLTRLNTLLMVPLYLGTVTGVLGAGLLIDRFGVDTTVTVTIILSATAFLLTALGAPRDRIGGGAQEKADNVVARAKAAFIEASNHRGLILILATGGGLIALAQAFERGIVPAMAIILDLDASRLALLFVAGNAGAVTGALLHSRFVSGAAGHVETALAAVVLGVCAIILIAMPAFAILLVVGFLGGMAIGPLPAIIATGVQKAVSRSAQAEALSWVMAAVILCAQGAVLIVGGAAEWIGINWTLAGMACAALVCLVARAPFRRAR